jgi:proteic killer suppression protein
MCYLPPITAGVIADVLESKIEVTWKSRKLEKTCASDSAGRRRWGAQNWRILQRRLATLDAAACLGDLENLPGRFHELRADRPGQFSLDLWGPTRLVFAPDHDPLPRRQDGGVDRSRVDRVRILEVVNYHD